MFRSRLCAKVVTVTVKSSQAKGTAQAFSAFSGNAFPPSLAEKLCTKGFTSTTWLTERQMKIFNVELKPEQKGKGFEMQTTNGEAYLLYNADQTTDAASVEKQKGSKVVVNAITGERIRGYSESSLNSIGSEVSVAKNHWVTELQVKELGLELKANAVPVTVVFEYDHTTTNPDGTLKAETRSSERVYYNVDQLADPKMIDKLRKLVPISAATGFRYRGSAANVLLHAAIKRNYASPFWITLAGAQGLGLTIADPSSGVDVSVGENKMVTFYNASQTSSPQKVATAAYKAQFSPRSAVSGSIYPEPTQSQLSSIALQRKFRSCYWLTEKQANFIGAAIRDGEVPVDAVMPDGVVRLFNADQTTRKEIIESRFKH